MAFDYFTQQNVLRKILLSEGIINPSPIENVDFSTYLSQVQQQNEQNLFYPKILDGIPSRYPINTSALPNPIDEVINNNYYYVGTQLLNGDLYYEFYKNTSPAFSLVEGQFQYVLVGQISTNLLSKVLPKVYTYDLNGIRVIYPDNLYLNQARVDSFDFMTVMLSEQYTQALLPGFVFTGRLTSNSRFILYEYQDVLGLYNLPYALYISPLRPDGLDYPFGHPRNNSLVWNTDCSYNVGDYPQVSNLSFTGRFTGYSTTPDYYAQTMYLYQRNNGTTFLTNAAPSYMAHMYSDLVSSLVTYPKLSMITTPGVQALYMKQSSTNDPSFHTL